MYPTPDGSSNDRLTDLDAGSAHKGLVMSESGDKLGGITKTKIQWVLEFDLPYSSACMNLMLPAFKIWTYVTRLECDSMYASVFRGHRAI